MESSKLISSLYAEARRFAPSIVYIDEIEALSTQRSGDETGAERRVISSLLTELDGLAGKSDKRYVLTIAATNIPWLLDKAILSRFEKKIFVPLPDERARESILRIHLEHQGIESDVSYKELAVMTEGYSGRELERISQEVVSRTIRGAAILGRTCCTSILHVGEPTARAASRYTFSLMPITAPLTDLAPPRPCCIAKRNTICQRPGPTIVTAAMIMIIPGKASQASTNLCTTMSNLPPRYPEGRPMIQEISTESELETTPTIIEI